MEQQTLEFYCVGMMYDFCNAFIQKTTQRVTIGVYLSNPSLRTRRSQIVPRSDVWLLLKDFLCKAIYNRMSFAMTFTI